MLIAPMNRASSAAAAFVERVRMGSTVCMTSAKASNMVLAASAEFIGTFMLVLVGTAVATAAFLDKNSSGAKASRQRTRKDHVNVILP